MPVFVGIDLGTSGCRAIAIDSHGEILAKQDQSLPGSASKAPGESEQQASDWSDALLAVLRQLCQQLDPADIQALLIDGTSATLLVCDGDGKPLSPALMYNDHRSRDQAGRIRQVAPPDSAAQGAGSSLAKLLYLADSGVSFNHALHQADWLAGVLTGEFGHSDENNCLKLGYDPLQRCWPDWLQQLAIDPAWLPRVHEPGDVIAPISASVARATGLHADTLVLAGTTDSTAAFLATGASEPGEAMTCLGSTLVIKLISEQPVFASQYGIYSHRILGQWLCGGASNSGGASLLQCFRRDELGELSPLIDPETNSGLDYYPLPGVGERFPLADPDLAPRMPGALPTGLKARARELQGLFEGIANIEAEGYRLLQRLGAPTPTRIYTTGGGAGNPQWGRIRERKLGVPVRVASHQDAAYGAALLARHGYQRRH